MDTLKKRKDDATSSETLEDLEDEGSWEGDDADQADQTGGPGHDADGPSPDGAFDEEDELNEADPL